MRKLFLVLVPLLALLSVGAVNFGDTLETVIADKGQPVSKLERGNVTVLTYSDAVIRLEDGKVVSLKQPGAEYATGAVAPKPMPRGARSGGSAGTGGQWTNNYDNALSAAAGTNRKIFLFFTGSDWCGWCKRLEAEVLSTPEFQEYARDNLILVKLDFPQSIPQSAQLKAQNQQLSQRYQIEGYPTVVVLNSSGKTIGRTGYKRGGPGPYIAQLQGY
jgi:protein disulfide-isomerase